MWPTEKVLRFIEDFHAASCLWEVTNPEYKNRIKKKIVIEELAKKYEVSVSDVEKKIHNLKTAFHREHKKINQAKKSGASPVKNAWFAYDHLLFLLQGSESRGSRSTDCDEERNNESGSTEDIVSTLQIYFYLIFIHGYRAENNVIKIQYIKLLIITYFK